MAQRDQRSNKEKKKPKKEVPKATAPVSPFAKSETKPAGKSK